MENVAILGSTGHIGTETLELIKSMPKKFKVVAISAKDEIGILEKQVKELKPKFAVVNYEEIAKQLEKRVKKTEILFGENGLKKIVSLPEIDLVSVAVSGFAGFKPTMQAIRAKKDIIIGNKESMMAGGKLLIGEAKKQGLSILPTDSEPSGAIQCLKGEKLEEVKKVLLFCSGGPLRFKTLKELEKITPKEALNHPDWNMGPKNSVDCATLMNKGMSLFEVSYFTGIPFEKIQVLMHPKTFMHSAIEFIDGSIKANLCSREIKIQIKYALMGGKYSLSQTTGFDLDKIYKMEFFPIDFETFPCLQYAMNAGIKGGTMPSVLNASNEEAVEAFLNGEIKFLDIPKILKQTMDSYKPIKKPSFSDIIEVHDDIRKKTKKMVERLK